MKLQVNGKEHDVAVPFLHAHRRVEEARQLARQGRELVEMRREQCAAAVLLVQVLDHEVGD